MNFHYVATQTDGKITEGRYEASGPAEVLEFLASKNLRPVSLKVVRGVEEIGQGKLFSRKITVTDKVFLTKYLALMLKVGTDLFKAIDILIADFDKPAVKALLTEIRNTLEKGQPFYVTFVKYPKYFSSVFVNLVKAGEASGNLERIFEDLSIALQKEEELRQRIKSALAYPLILIAGSILMLAFLVTFALPKIANVFSSSAIEPPTFSKIVFSVGLFLNKYIFVILALLILVGIALWYFIVKTEAGRKIFRHLINRIPVINRIIKRVAFQRFASTFGLLLGAGLPILDSLEITADAVGDDEIKEALNRISREGVSRGLTIGDAFRRETVFPRVIVNLMAISEKAGHIEDILGTLAGFYDTEIDSSIKMLITFLEPALLLGIGVIIGTIALAIIVPVYQLVGQF